MSDPRQTNPPPEAQPTNGHEPNEIRLGVVVGGIGGIVLLLVAVAWFTYGVYEFLAARRGESSEARNLARGSPALAGPALNAEQPTQLRALRAGEEQHLKTYGWID